MIWCNHDANTNAINTIPLSANFTATGNASSPNCTDADSFLPVERLKQFLVCKLNYYNNVLSIQSGLEIAVVAAGFTTSITPVPFTPAGMSWAQIMLKVDEYVSGQSDNNTGAFLDELCDAFQWDRI